MTEKADLIEWSLYDARPCEWIDVSWSLEERFDNRYNMVRWGSVGSLWVLYRI